MAHMTFTTRRSTLALASAAAFLLPFEARPQNTLAPVTVTGASVFWARAWRERRSAAAEARASVERRVVKVM